MRKVERTRQLTLAYSASNPASLDLGSPGFWVTGMLLTLELAKTGATITGTYQDYLYRSISALSLSGGGRNYLNISGPDLRVLYWHNRLRGTNMLRVPDIQSGGVTMIHQLPIIFSANPIRPDGKPNYFDPLFGVAPDSDLTFSITWGAASACGSDTTIGAGTIARVTLFGVIPPDPNSVPKFYPEWTVLQHQPTQTYTGLGDTVAVPTGWYYRRTTVMALNGASPSDLRTDGKGSNAVSEIGFQTSDARDPVNIKTWIFSQQSQDKLDGIADDNTGVPGAAAAYGTSTTKVGYNPGVGSLDWVDRLDTSNPANCDPLLGANLIDKQNLALQMAYTVDAATNTNIVQFHERYKKYSWA